MGESKLRIRRVERKGSIIRPVQQLLKRSLGHNCCLGKKNQMVNEDDLKDLGEGIDKESLVRKRHTFVMN